MGYQEKKKKKKLTKESLHLHIHLLHALCYISTEDDGTHWVFVIKFIWYKYKI